jgi:phosphoglycolate phosphatase
MSRDKKVFLFDFDGTIADTMDVILDIYNTTVAPAFKCKPLAVRDKERMRTLHPRDVMHEYNVTLVKLPFMVLRARKELAKRIDEIQPFAGIVPALNKIKARKCILGILTQNSRANVGRFCANHNLEGVFDFVHTSKHAFSKHRNLKRIMRWRKLTPNQLIYIADETRDIEAAKKAGLRIAAVTWGYNKRAALEKRNPDWLVSSPEELEEILD